MQGNWAAAVAETVAVAVVRMAVVRMRMRMGIGMRPDRNRNEDKDEDSQHGRGSVWDYEGHPAFAEHCLFVDDVWFSGHLAKNGVGVWTIGATGRDAEYTAVDGVAPLHRTGSRDAHNVGCARAMRDVFGVWGGSRDGGGRPS